MNEIELFFATYEKTAEAIYTFTLFLVGVSAIIYRFFVVYDRIKTARKEKDYEIGKRLNNIETRLHLLDCPEEGRVNKLSKLCESQIESNKKALSVAYYVKGRLRESP